MKKRKKILEVMLIIMIVFLLILLTILPIFSVRSSSALPDLIVDSLYFSPAKPVANESVSFNFTVRNKGLGAVMADYKTQIFIDDKLISAFTDDSRLSAGSFRRWRWDITWPNDEDAHTFKVVVDATDVILEIDENNNSASISASASSQCVLTVNVSPENSGKVILDPPGGVYQVGDKVTLTAVANENYQFSKWSGSISGSANPITVTMDSDKAITAVFIDKSHVYTITASASTGGSISPEGGVTVEEGKSQVFTILPDPGYRIKDVLVDGKSIGIVTSYTFSNVSDSHTIEAFFEKSVEQGDITIVLYINKSVFTVNGNSKQLDSPPIIKNGRTLLPIRPVVESLGGIVDWSASDKKITVSLRANTIELWIGKNTAKVNGKSVQIDLTNSSVVPEIIKGRTMVPLRFVAENLGCSVLWDSSNQKITVIYNANMDILSASGSKVFSSAGGEIVLADGTRFVVPAGVFSKDTKVQLFSILNPVFSGMNARCLRINGLKDMKKESVLNVSVDKGLKNTEIDVFGYDFDKSKRIDFSYTYDSNSGLVSVKIVPSSYTQIDDTRIYIQYVKSYTPMNKENVIEMPYYAQIGNSGVEACAQMLLKKQGTDVELFDILKSINASDTDFGLNEVQFMNNFRLFLQGTLSSSVIHSSFFNVEQLKWRVLSLIDKGVPVILRCSSSSALLVVGYTNGGNAVVVHDPQNISPVNNKAGTMYTVRSWDWIKSLSSKYFVLYASNVPVSSANSLTVECPGKNEAGVMVNGEVSFYKSNSSTKYGVQVKPSSSNGYIWTDASKTKVEYIPVDADALKISVPVFNSSAEKKEATVKVSIYEDKGSNLSYGKELTSHSQKFSVNGFKLNSSSTVAYQHEFKLEDIRDLGISDQNGKEKILISVSLLVGSNVVDSFYIRVTLDVLPKIVNVNPTNGKAGDIVTITGYAFGKNKSSKGRVLINGVNAEIVSWSDTEIKAKLPAITGSASVVVYTGELYEYSSSKGSVFGGSYDGNYVVQFSPPFYGLDAKDLKCKWIYGRRVDHISVTLKGGKVYSSSSSNFYNSYQEVSGTYDSKGNITFSFTIKDLTTTDMGGYMVTGTFTGKFVSGKGSYFEGTITGNARDFTKLTGYSCCPHDEVIKITVDAFTSAFSP